MYSVHMHVLATASENLNHKCRLLKVALQAATDYAEEDDAVVAAVYIHILNECFH